MPLPFLGFSIVMFATTGLGSSNLVSDSRDARWGSSNWFEITAALNDDRMGVSV